jgi:hypothetical protein
MTTQLAPPGAAAPTSTEDRTTGRDAPSLLAPRRTWPQIYRWALIGAGFLALEAFVIITWFTSGEATRTPGGADPVSNSVQNWALIMQILCPAIAVVCLTYVVRQCRRQHRLTFDAVLMIAWILVYWQDPLLNYLRPTFFYSTELINLGSWTSRVPGWMSPRGHLLAEPIVWAGSVYAWFLFASMLTCAAMKTAKRRWPNLGVLGLMGAGWASMFLFDLIIEVIFVRTHLYTYAATVKVLTLWPGTWNQFPIYESILWGGVMAMTGFLRYFRDDRGRSVVERGVDQLSVTTGKKNILRILAVAGCLNVMFVFGYNLPIQVFNLHVDDTVEVPTWMSSGICGDDTPYDCPGPDTPIYLRGQSGTR